MTPSQKSGLLDLVKRYVRELERPGDCRFELFGRNQFSALLDHLHDKHHYPLSTEMAIDAALAVVAREGDHDWEPPDPIRVGILTAMCDPLNQDPRGADAHLRRANEFTLAYLLGWRRCPGLPTCDLAEHGTRDPIHLGSKDWEGLSEGAQDILWRFMHRHISFGLEQLAQVNRKGGVPDFPVEDPRNWTDGVLHRLVAHVDRCNCWKHIAPRTDPSKLRGNARAKAECCLRQHNLDTWNPVERTRQGDVKNLWYFIERAVKGFVGRAFRHEGFPSGMLHAQLWDHDLRLVRVNVIRRRCPQCGWTVRRRCKHGEYRPERDSLIRKNWLILQDTQGEPMGGFIRTRYWTCSEGHLYPDNLSGCPVPGCSTNGKDRHKGARRMTCYCMD